MLKYSDERGERKAKRYMTSQIRHMIGWRVRWETFDILLACFRFAIWMVADMGCRGIPHFAIVVSLLVWKLGSDFGFLRLLDHLRFFVRSLYISDTKLHRLILSFEPKQNAHILSHSFDDDRQLLNISASFWQLLQVFARVPKLIKDVSRYFNEAILEWLLCSNNIRDRTQEDQGLLRPIVY